MKSNTSLFCLLLLFFFNSPSINAQVWFENNPEWIYDYTFFDNRGYVVDKVVGDTMLLGCNCSVIEGYITSVNYTTSYADTSVSGPFYNYISVRSDSVLYYSDSSFYMMYDFGMQPGDSLLINEEEVKEIGIPGLYFVLDSMGSIQIDGQIRRTQHLFLLGEFYDSTRVTVIEGLGIVEQSYINFNDELRFRKSGSIIPAYQYFSVIDAPAIDFCAFKDDLIFYDPLEENCQELPLPLSVKRLEEIDQFLTIRPNPVHEQCYFDWPKDRELLSIRIYSSDGQLLEKGDRPANEWFFQTNYKGMLFIQFLFPEGSVIGSLFRN
ncbi:MAG: hypothetical protein AAF990_25120 [Bacteroidota bacterium]